MRYRSFFSCLFFFSFFFVVSSFFMVRDEMCGGVSERNIKKQREVVTNIYKVEATQIPITPEEYLALREPKQNLLFASVLALPGMFFLSLLSSTSPIPFDDRRDIISE